MFHVYITYCWSYARFTIPSCIHYLLLVIRAFHHCFMYTLLIAGYTRVSPFLHVYITYCWLYARFTIPSFIHYLLLVIRAFHHSFMYTLLIAGYTRVSPFLHVCTEYYRLYARLPFLHVYMYIADCRLYARLAIPLCIHYLLNSLTRDRFLHIHWWRTQN